MTETVSIQPKVHGLGGEEQSEETRRHKASLWRLLDFRRPRGTTGSQSPVLESTRNQPAPKWAWGFSVVCRGFLDIAALPCRDGLGWYSGGTLGADELGPVLPPVKAQFPAPHLVVRFPLNVDGQISCAALGAVLHVLQVSKRGAAAFGKGITLIRVHIRKEGFQVHDRIKPFGFVRVNTLWFSSPAVLGL